MNEFVQAYWWAGVIIAAVFAYLAGKVDFAPFLSFFKNLVPKTKPDDSVQSAVQHLLALKDHCKDCPAAKSALEDLWGHLGEIHLKGDN